MNLQQQHVYQLQQLEQQKKYRAYIKLMRCYARIRQIAYYIYAGGSATDPDVKDDYFYLVSEFGEDVFNEELKKIRIELGKKDNG